LFKKLFLEDSWISYAFAVLLAILVRSFLWEPFNVPSGSMIPSLLVGDHIMTKKYTYGYSRYSFPFGLVPIAERIFEDIPERGQVIVFRQTKNTSVDYVKRLIGLPGDKIQVKKGRLYLNGKMVERKSLGKFTLVTLPPDLKKQDIAVKNAQKEYKVHLENNKYLYLNDKIVKNDYVIDYRSESECARDAGLCGVFEFDKYQEYLPNGLDHMIIERSDNEEGFDNTQEFEVPAGHYFMMGDNRDNSADSRFDLGYVPARNLIGPVTGIFFAHDSSVSWWKFWAWGSSLRLSRFFKSVE
jgi:signal peptidase I